MQARSAQPWRKNRKDAQPIGRCVLRAVNPRERRMTGEYSLCALLDYIKLFRFCILWRNMSMYRFFERLLCGTDKTVLAPVGQRRALRGGRFGTERRKKRRRNRGREAHTPHRCALAVSPPPTFFGRVNPDRLPSFL